MNPNEKIMLTKMSGKDNKEIELGYWIIGAPMSEPAVGRSWSVLREMRNGIEIPGIFRTSEIIALTPIDPWRTIVTTENSTWLMEVM